MRLAFRARTAFVLPDCEVGVRNWGGFEIAWEVFITFVVFGGRDSTTLTPRASSLNVKVGTREAAAGHNGAVERRAEVIGHVMGGQRAVESPI
jgi:hypothetical protein